MRGIITHEESQTVTKEFRERGHEFYSNDLQTCSGGHPEWHIKSDCFAAVKDKQLDFLGMHPVCTYLTNSGVCWLTSVKSKAGFEWSEHYQIFINPQRWALMVEAANHFKDCLNSIKAVGRGYAENPIMHKYAMEIIGVKQSQVIQPYMFGHLERKATCLWLVGLPNLRETKNVFNGMMQLPKKERERIHYASPSPERAKLRSKTFKGIAQAMADQWGQ